VQDILRWLIILACCWVGVAAHWGDLMRPIALALAVITGLLVLAGYFIAPLASLLSILLNWAIIVAGAATIVGVFNLILVHGTRIHNRERGAAYSAVLLVSLFATFIFGSRPDIQRYVISLAPS
jgi:hypothetical protein